jgi:iron complex outermembrane receptor protein
VRALAGLAAVLLCAPAVATPRDDLARMSLEDLTSVEVTSVSKSAEPLQRAPSAVYVITHSDIVRSGATSIAEVLRLAPNLRITQLTASNYVTSARGFGGNTTAQNFSNKILMLIDGRSVYSPLFSGIYTDVQDVMLEDIERIEVISGPGATLWGANAMNGVINIITRAAYLTDGSLLAVAAGNQEQNLGVRYGGAIGEDAAFRVYGKAFNRGALELADGSSAGDSWSKVQGGFRSDWSRAADSFTLQGDAYRGSEGELGTDAQRVSGANVLTRWIHKLGPSQISVQAYADQTERAAPAGGDAFVLHTYDLEAQQSVILGGVHRIVWGFGERINSYEIRNSATLLFEPTARKLSLGDVFAQDTLSLSAAVDVTLGAKLEDNPYSGWSFEPDARLSWMLGPDHLLWAAASRAIRSPTPFDVDVVEKQGTTTFLTGNPSFQPERVRAYEVGYRGHYLPSVSLSVSVFYNVYQDLRTIETASDTVFLPLRWGNMMQGDTYGLESWGDWQVTEHWRLSPGLRLLHKSLRFSPGASGLLGLAQAGDDPSSQASLKSSLDLPRELTLDAVLRYVGDLPAPAVPSYFELNARLGWRATRSLELSVTGTNLLHAHHLEYAAPDGEEIGRSALAEARWRF